MNEVAVASPRRQSLASRVVSLAKEDPILVISAVVCVAIVLLVVFGPLLSPYSPSQTDILNSNAPSSGAHLLGTDDLGRDILSRLLYGARLSLIGPALVVVLAATLGTLMAIASAWYGGWTDSGLMRFANILFAVPGILLAIVAVAIFSPGIVAPILALGIAYSPYFARVGRAILMQERGKPYVEASLLAGFRVRRIWFFHLLPSLRPILVAQCTVAFGFALLDLAAISFMGLGVQPPSAEWGLMVSQGRAALVNGYPQATLWAGGIVVVTVVAFVVLGERLSARAKRDA